MKKYLASVRIKGQTVKMTVFAESSIHARLILEYQFGMNSLASAPVQVNEASTIKPLTPDQAKVKSMQVRVKQDQQALKAERARQKIKRAQLTLTKIN
jgi:hypothetical protein